MSPPAGCTRPAARGFTILELTITVLVISILAVMLFPVYGIVQGRLEKTRCTANLRSLHVAASLYIQDHHQWPQLVFSQGMDPADIAHLWISTFQPYGLNQINWICPTCQRLLQSPDLTDPTNARVDYSATMFDSNPQTPFQWAKQPWFVESSNVHGNGNLIVFPDGHIQEMNDFFKGGAAPSASP